MKKILFQEMGTHGVYFSRSKDAIVNLALEEALMARVEGLPCLLLYENSPTIVFGRFQNPWRECRLGLARRQNVAFCRRCSGGGTVVHGPGNLNFSVISGLSRPDKEGNLDRLRGILGRLGIPTESSKHHDLMIRRQDDLYKVSGSAFRQSSKASMHHATLLIDAELDMFQALLRIPSRDIEGRGVRSRPSPVANLSSVQCGLMVWDVVQAMAAEWFDGASLWEIDPGDCLDDLVFQDALIRLGRPEWIWDKTPKFVEGFSRLPGWGDEILKITVQDGHIISCPGASMLIGCPYHGKDILKAGNAEGSLWITALATRVDGD